jgi:GT2 family glycosyltransferase
MDEGGAPVRRGDGSRVEITVVIATVGRADRLAASLAAYANLDPGTPPFEVIVVLDGEDGASRAAASRPYPFPLRVLAQPRSGIGPAKNLGARAAAGDLVLFLNDDTRPDRKCLRVHADTQARFGPSVVLGRVDWDPEHEITPYMAWLAPKGHQFNYARLQPDGSIPWDACWGAHLAVPRAWMLDEPFEPRLPFSALEDGEWAYRQARRGRPLRYASLAQVWHHHHFDGPADFRWRPRAAAGSARWLALRHPRLAFKLVVRPILAAAAATALAVWPGRWRRATLWDLDFRWSYVLGLFFPPER